MNKSHLNYIIYNSRINYKYFIEKTFEAGLVLLGWEVKTIRLKLITIDNSYVSFKEFEAFIYNAICKTPLNNKELTYNPIRAKKLLLKKKELLFLKNKVNQSRYTAVILGLFWKNSWIKANIGIAKGKKEYDKRNSININLWKKEKIHIMQNIK